MPRDASRVEVLARRVGWLDRYRRWLAIAITLVVCPLLLLRTHAGLAEFVTTEWPRLHAMLVTTVVFVTLWMIIETALAWLTAVWETDCVHLMREHRVPPARLLRRRK